MSPDVYPLRWLWAPDQGVRAFDACTHNEGKKIKPAILKMSANPAAYPHPGQAKLTKCRISKSGNQPLSSPNVRRLRAQLARSKAPALRTLRLQPWGTGGPGLASVLLICPSATPRARAGGSAVTCARADPRRRMLQSPKFPWGSETQQASEHPEVFAAGTRGQAVAVAAPGGPQRCRRLGPGQSIWRLMALSLKRLSLK